MVSSQCACAPALEYCHFCGDGVDKRMSLCIGSSSSVLEVVPITDVLISLAKTCRVNPSESEAGGCVIFSKGGHCQDGDRI